MKMALLRRNNDFFEPLTEIEQKLSKKVSEKTTKISRIFRNNLRGKKRDGMIKSRKVKSM